MKTTARITGGNRLLQKLKAHPQLIHREIESVLKQEARALCVEYAGATMPGPGLQDGGKVEAFRNTVEADVKRVYSVRSDPRTVFEQMKTDAPHLAAAYWHAIKSKKPRKAADIIRRANLAQGCNPAIHKTVRTGAHGRVRKNQQPVQLATEAQLRVIVRKQRALVGFAKAGWACAAKGLGGRVRRNLRDGAGGNRKTEEKFPPYVRALARKFPDAGGARITSAGSIVTIEIFTNVKHALNALPPRLHAAVTSRAQASVTAALTHAVRELNRERFAAA